MARQVKVVPPEQLRKGDVPQPVEPTLESRVSGLEWRMSHPNTPRLGMILADLDNGIRFRKEFQRCCREMKVALLDGDRIAGGITAENADVASRADAAPGRSAGVIWGALLGASLALAVLAVCNPAAFHRPRPVDFSTEWKMQTVYPATQPPAAVRESSTQSGTLTLAAPISGIEITPQVDCWLSVKDAKGKTWVSQTMEAHHFFQLNGEAGRPLEVRSGCPGQIMYRVDGAEVRPVNHSGTPDKSEVVSLP